LSHNIYSIIVKLAARCNLNCGYCYIYNHEDRTYLHRPRLMTDAVFDATIHRIHEYCAGRPGHSISITFHGGEPTLIGATRFGVLVTRAKERLGPALRSLSIQTNATLIDASWAICLRDHQVSVGVSLDGPAAVHDAVRVDHRGRGTHAKTIRGLLRLREAGIEPKVLSVINPGHDGLAVYRHFRDQEITWMDFLPPDVSHDNKQSLYGRFGRTPVADFLLPIFDHWFREDNPAIVIGIFVDLLQRLMGGPGRSDGFGNPLMPYLIVETDGAIEGLDVLRVCDEGLTASGLNVLHHGFDELRRGLPLVYRAVHQGFRLCKMCQACEYHTVCGGGYLPHRYSRVNGFDNPSVWCNDIMILLHHMRDAVRSHQYA
jgi:uncharacterized protein